MKNESDILKSWSILTLAFVSVVVICVVILMTIRFANVNALSKNHIKTLVERKIHYELTDIAEEVYLRLDNIDLRQKDLQDLLDAYGTIEFNVLNTKNDQKDNRWITKSDGDDIYIPLQFGDKSLGYLKISIKWTDTWSLVEGNTALIQVLLLCVVFGILWLFLARFIRNNLYTPIINELITAKQDKAIAQTVQMLAHDVRKPFSMLQGVLGIVNNARSPDEILEITHQATPEINRAIQSVNGMIQDVMEVGSQGQVLPEIVNPENVIEDSIRDVVGFDKTIDVQFNFELYNRNRLNIDPLKVSRVLSNIIGNAIQANKKKGKIWIKLSKSGSGWTHITVGNSNSYIPKEARIKLFEAFYTSGKKNGTGLGLAIAKKVVEAHNGKIWCTSDKELGTEFHFTLPSIPLVSNYRGSLSKSSSDYRVTPNNTSKPRVLSNDDEQLLENRLIKFLKNGARKTILLVDDEELYRTVLKDQLTHNSEITSLLDIICVGTGEEAINIAMTSDIHIAIIDVDMGAMNLDGFSTTKALRHLGSKATICIHSNRTESSYHKMAIKSGADMYIAKTMPRSHLLRLIIDSFEESFDPGYTSQTTSLGPDKSSK